MDNKKNLVLVVDDNADNRKLLGSLLSAEAYEVGMASDGFKALEFIKNIQPDIILLDIMMPVMDGFEVCSKIKKEEAYKDIPIIFITAKNDLDSIVKGFENGAVDYIFKPFEPSELKARVRNHLELKRAKELIAIKNQELEDLNAVKNRLFSIIGHDLRNPIGGIKSLIESVLTFYDLKNNDELIESLLILQRTANSTYDLLENLLTWAKAQKDETQFSPELKSINEIVLDSIKLLSEAADKKNIQIVSQINEVNAFFDCNMIKTVLRNLISNAVKYSFQSGIITISAKENDKNITITVKDNGIGISKANLDKVFNRKEHFTTYGTADEEGTGLGLSICYEFIQKHGGKIWVESEENKGSSFNFTLAKEDLK